MPRETFENDPLEQCLTVFGLRARISRSAPAVVNLLISATNVVVKASASRLSDTTEVRGPTRSSKSDADSASVRSSFTMAASSVIKPRRGPFLSTRALVPWVEEYLMC